MNRGGFQDPFSDQIYIIKNKKVMPNKDLAKLYAIETKVLKQSVRHIIDRFPKFFMLESSKKRKAIF